MFSSQPTPCKVVRTYIWKEKTVVPINPRDEEIEGLKCAKSLSELPEPKDVAVSVVTPPGKAALALTRVSVRVYPCAYV